MPVVVVAPNDTLIEKLKSNLQEVRARGGELFVFADADSRINSGEGLHVIRLPEHYGVLSPILHVVPLQLLAYHTATVRGMDVNKPGNFAKPRDGIVMIHSALARFLVAAVSSPSSVSMLGSTLSSDAGNARVSS